MWRTTIYKDDDEKKICELFANVWGGNQVFLQEKVDLKHWNWEYRENPAGSAIIRLAKVDEMVVGHFALIPMRIQLKGKEEIGAESLDTMTHPSYRRQGIFVSLAEQALQDSKEKEIAIIYAIPNQNSYHGYTEKLQFRTICSIPLLIFIIDSQRICEKYLKNKIFSKLSCILINRLSSVLQKKPKVQFRAYQFTQISRFDERFDRLWENARKSYHNLIIRDS